MLLDSWSKRVTQGPCGGCGCPVGGVLPQVSYLISEEIPLPKDEMAARVADIIYAAFSPTLLP